jgi:DNA-binding NtrC family response regulator
MIQTRFVVLAVGLREQDHSVLRQELSLSNGTLATARTIAEAARFLERNPAPVIFCERNLPDGTWKDLVEAAAAGGRRANVIVTSRLADDRLWAEVLNLGGYDVLAKPLDGSEVSHAVASAWRNRRYAEAARAG